MVCKLAFMQTQLQNPDQFNVLTNTRLGPMLANRNDRYVGQSILAYGEFSEGEAQMFRQLVGSGDVVIEAGANIGAHTLLLSRLVGATGLVYAYEPQRIVFQTLCGNNSRCRANIPPLRGWMPAFGSNQDAGFGASAAAPRHCLITSAPTGGLN